MRPRYLPDGRRYVRGDGPLPCRVLFLGESPGDDEDDSGQAFVGRTGQLCNELWKRAGWRRGRDFRVENVLAYKPEHYDTDGEIQVFEIERDRPRLLRQLGRCRPRLVFAMGALAMEAMIGPWLRGQGVEPKLEWAWGLGFEAPRPDDPTKICVVVVAHHPASGFHDPSMAARFWRALTSLKSPTIWRPDTGKTDYQRAAV